MPAIEEAETYRPKHLWKEGLTNDHHNSTL